MVSSSKYLLILYACSNSQTSRALAITKHSLLLHTVLENLLQTQGLNRVVKLARRSQNPNFIHLEHYSNVLAYGRTFGLDVARLVILQGTFSQNARMHAKLIYSN
jgi:hypothetical protein